MAVLDSLAAADLLVVVVHSCSQQGRQFHHAGCQTTAHSQAPPSSRRNPLPAVPPPHVLQRERGTAVLTYVLRQEHGTAVPECGHPAYAQQASEGAPERVAHIHVRQRAR